MKTLMILLIIEWYWNMNINMNNMKKIMRKKSMKNWRMNNETEDNNKYEDLEKRR